LVKNERKMSPWNLSLKAVFSTIHWPATSTVTIQTYM
jgi:hypothetical protein